MKEKRDQIKTRFSALSANQKIHLIALLEHNVTIAARGHYDEPEECTRIKKSRAFNEILHTTSSQIAHMAAAQSKRYPDDVFIEILFDKARFGDCEAALLWAFENAWPRQ